MIHDSNRRPLPPAQTPLGMVARTETEHRWVADLLHSVTEMQIVPEIRNTPAADQLLGAIALAQEGKSSNLLEIEKLLRQVFGALRKGAGE